MGKIYSKLTRPIRTFNVANRAEKVISQEKPVPAPQYAATERQKKLTNQANPHFLENHYRKNVQLDQRLKDVFVTSADPQMKTEPRESKFLPQSRVSSSYDSIFDPYETITIPEGKCSLKQALTFMLQHKQDPTTYASESIASEYKIDKKVVDDILKYFKLYVTVSKDNPEPMEDELQQILNKAIDMAKKEKEDKEKKK